MRQLLLYALCLIAPASAAGQTACLGSHDTNGNGTVDIEDFLSILGVFGDVDTDGDGIWDSADLCTNAEACNFQLVPTLPCVFNDAVGICGGDCEADLDNDGICDWLCGDLVSYQGYDYATVHIGEQCWFSENLRSENYRDGDLISSSGLETSDFWWSITQAGEEAIYGEFSSSCWDNATNGPACDEEWSLEQFGRLYNWHAVDDQRGLCPYGWHVPSNEDWTSLTDYLGSIFGEYFATTMKAESGWGESGNGSDYSGFQGLPGGKKLISGQFVDAGHSGFWWSSNPSGNGAWTHSLHHDDYYISLSEEASNNGLSVRCIQD